MAPNCNGSAAGRRTALRAVRGAVLTAHAAAGLVASVGAHQAAERVCRAAEGLLRSAAALLEPASASLGAEVEEAVVLEKGMQEEQRQQRRKRRDLGTAGVIGSGTSRSARRRRRRAADKAVDAAAGMDIGGDERGIGSGDDDGGGGEGAMEPPATCRIGDLAGQGIIALPAVSEAAAAARGSGHRGKAQAAGGGGGGMQGSCGPSGGGAAAAATSTAAAGNGNRAMGSWLSAAARPRARLREQLG